MADFYFVLIVVALYAVTHLLAAAVARLEAPAGSVK
jgi:hypothetical protein